MLPEIAHEREFSERKRLPAREALFEAVPEGHPVLPEMPAEQHEIAAFGVTGREVDEPAVEVLHLHAGRLELGNEKPDLVRDFLDGALDLLRTNRIEPAAVPRHLSLEPGEALPVGDEAAARGDEPFDKRRNDAQRLVRLLLAEEPHTC